MAIINHQLCYFLSGDYLGEERLRGGRERAKVIGSVQHKQRCAREVVWLLVVRYGCIAGVGCCFQYTMVKSTKTSSSQYF